jgi:hypothetical protein
MKERNLRDAIQQFRSGIKKTDYGKVKGNRDYLSVAYRLKFCREYFGETMSIQTDSTELSNGSHKFKANIYLNGELVSVGESKQMSNKEKDFEKSQTVSIGRGLSLLGFMGDEIATKDEMESFWQDDKPFVEKKITKDKIIASSLLVDVTKLANDWIAKLKEIAKDESSPHKFEKNYQIQVKQFESEIKQIRLDPIEDLRVETEYAKLKSQIQNNQGKNNGRL